VDDVVSLLQVATSESTGRQSVQSARITKRKTEDSSGHPVLFMSEGSTAEESRFEFKVNSDEVRKAMNKVKQHVNEERRKDQKQTAIQTSSKLPGMTSGGHLPMPSMGEIQHPETIDGLMNIPRQSSSGGGAHTHFDNLMSSSSQSQNIAQSTELVAKKAAPQKQVAHVKEEPAKAKTEAKKVHKKKKLLKKKKHLKKKKKGHYGKAVHLLDRYPAIFSDLLQIVKIRPLLDKVMEEATGGGGDKGGKSAGPQKPPWEDFSMEKEMEKAKQKKKMKTKAKPLNILSYGTGDANECMTLRKYFPNATIHGVDYDEELIAKNREENDDPKIEFYSTPESLKQGGYDVVLGLDYLCSQNNWKPLTHDEWESRVAVMDFLLKPGGYLVTYNSNYPMNLFSKADNYEAQVMSCDQALSPATKVLDMKGNEDPHDWNVGMCAPWAKYCRESGWRPKFDKAGKMLQQMGGGGASFGCLFPGTVFRKTGPKPAPK
jgi:hypothetical protein